LSGNRVKTAPNWRQQMKVRPRRGGQPTLLIALTAFMLLAGGLTWRVAGAAPAAQGPSLSWTVEQLSDGTQEANTPTIVTDRAGGIHVFWSEGNVGDDQSAILYAHLVGDQWSVGDVIVGKDILYTNAALDRRGYFHLVWTQNGTLYYSNAFYEDAGDARAWLTPVNLGGPGIYYPVLMIDSDGGLHIFYANVDDESTIEHLTSLDLGLSWSEQEIYVASDPASRVTDRPRAALSPSGTMHLIWAEVPFPELYGGAGVYYSQSDDDGKNWSDPIRLDAEPGSDPGLGAWQASIAVRSDSEIHVVWNSHSEAGRRYHQYSLDGGQTWSAPVPIWGSFVSQTGPNPLVAVPNGGLYMLSAGTFNWNDPQGVYVSRWTGQGWLIPQLIYEDVNQPHYLAPVIAGGTMLHVVWEAREQTPRAVWHAQAELNAEPIAPQPMPTRGSSPTPEWAVPLASTAAALPSAAGVMTPTAAPPATVETPQPVGASTIAVLAGLLSVIVPFGVVLMVIAIKRR
jgi:hypothetical protein